MSAHEDKATRYIGLLNAARVNGSWNEFPELIRKVNKHAPQRTVLTQTAAAEHHVATNATQRPQTTHSSSSTTVDTLQRTIEGSQDHTEEIFQGRTCLAWAAFTGISNGTPHSIPVGNVIQLFDTYGRRDASLWTKICLLKAVSIQGKSQMQRGEELQAVAIYKAAASWVELNNDLVKATPQMAYWAEQILAAYGTGSTDAVSTEARSRALQTWSTLVLRSQEVSRTTYGDSGIQISRTSVWEYYYDMAIRRLEQPNHTTTHTRAKLAAELRAIETAYETALLKNKKFPKATESNVVIEQWVERVVRNWQILCGPGWQESDLGPGGRNAATRNVLDILYRAATKTFHSTLILRRLFQVHKSLAEFDLAYHCLDTYIELVERARERAAKAGEPSPESEEIMLLVVAEGVEGLCSYGHQEEARKAFDLVSQLEDWLDEIVPDEHEVVPNGHADSGHTTPTPPSNEAVQVVYRAIGIGRAHWARWTPFSETRSTLQSDALEALQKASRLSDPHPQTLYALALLCAETRDISQAVKWTKMGLQKLTQLRSQGNLQQQGAFWHLMTLLLSSQQDFDTALQSSIATLDNVLGPTLFNGHESLADDPSTRATEQIADDLECDDLQKVVEVQITYLALTELMDGPEAALNVSGELLSLYAKLFKRFEVGDIKPAIDEMPPPPKTSAGTIKSVRGSIFSRRKATPSLAPSVTTTSLRSVANTDISGRPGTQTSQAPTIQVTDETGKSSSKKHHHLVHRHHEHKDSRLSKDTRPLNTRRITEEPESLEKEPFASADGQTSPKNTAAIDHAPLTGRIHDDRSEAKQDLGTVPHNVTSHDQAPPPLGHPEQPPEQDVRLPNINSSSTSTSPIPRSSKTAAQKHAFVVLNKMWLMISTLYRRSHMFEDAREACEEAAKAASRVEALITIVDASARSLANPGWGGGGKSSDEVWADVYCSKAELLLAIAQRREKEGTVPTSEAWRDIVEQYEHCLMYYPNHSAGIIGLSNILLDYYDKKIDLAKKVDDGRSFGSGHASGSKDEDIMLGAQTPSQEHLHDPFISSSETPEDLRKTPENLNRIAARDRAYGLLNTLTKLGSGWDNSEAWFALARAHELGGEIEKAKKILWWCIELEDTRPIRHWRNLGCGGYVL
ncbi:hypothetical protein LTR05_006868 [Lithohypha guttulata]|uniref:Filamentation protein n=1 Tax=Lithohypha guttulata TaxID=1690604 RepID=A0AAN7SWL9_9EURO|nr:hypothetical protein LTR05_006868 [Lithohypha guttulata]